MQWQTHTCMNVRWLAGRHATHTHTCMHIQIHMHVHTCINRHMHACTLTHTHTPHTHTHTHTHTHMHAHTHTHTHMHACMHACTHTHTHTHARTHMYHYTTVSRIYHRTSPITSLWSISLVQSNYIQWYISFMVHRPPSPTLPKKRRKQSLNQFMLLTAKLADMIVG